MNNKKIIIADILIYLLNDVLGWFVIILFDLTGYDGKFQNNLSVHWLMLVIGFVHIFISILCSILFYKKDRTKYHIQIGKKLFIYNIVMSVFPYLYLALVNILV